MAALHVGLKRFLVGVDDWKQVLLFDALLDRRIITIFIRMVKLMVMILIIMMLIKMIVMVRSILL